MAGLDLQMRELSRLLARQEEKSTALSIGHLRTYKKKESSTTTAELDLVTTSTTTLCKQRKGWATQDFYLRQRAGHPPNNIP
jgi:hypothetical protein